MQMPDEFKMICRNMGQDIGVMVKSMPELTALVTATLTSQQKSMAKDYIDSLLAGPSDAGQLQEVWWSSPAQVHFAKDEHLLEFLKAVSLALSQPPRLPS